VKFLFIFLIIIVTVTNYLHTQHNYFRKTLYDDNFKLSICSNYKHN